MFAQFVCIVHGKCMLSGTLFYFSFYVALGLKSESHLMPSWNWGRVNLCPTGRRETWQTPSNLSGLWQDDCRSGDTGHRSGWWNHCFSFLITFTFDLLQWKIQLTRWVLRVCKRPFGLDISRTKSLLFELSFATRMPLAKNALTILQGRVRGKHGLFWHFAGGGYENSAGGFGWILFASRMDSR